MFNVTNLTRHLKVHHPALYSVVHSFSLMQLNSPQRSQKHLYSTNDLIWDHVSYKLSLWSWLIALLLNEHHYDKQHLAAVTHQQQSSFLSIWHHMCISILRHAIAICSNVYKAHKRSVWSGKQQEAFWPDFKETVEKTWLTCLLTWTSCPEVKLKSY